MLTKRNFVLCAALFLAALCITNSTEAQDGVVIIDDRSETHTETIDPHDSHHVPIENDHKKPMNFEYQLQILEYQKRSQFHPVMSILAGSGFMLIGLPILVNGGTIGGLVAMGIGAVFLAFGAIFFRRNTKINQALDAERQRLLHGFSLTPQGLQYRF